MDKDDVFAIEDSEGDDDEEYKSAQPEPLTGSKKSESDSNLDIELDALLQSVGANINPSVAPPPPSSSSGDSKQFVNWLKADYDNFSTDKSTSVDTDIGLDDNTYTKEMVDILGEKPSQIPNFSAPPPILTPVTIPPIPQPKIEKKIEVKKENDNNNQQREERVSEPEQIVMDSFNNEGENGENDIDEEEEEGNEEDDDETIDISPAKLHHTRNSSNLSTPKHLLTNEEKLNLLEKEVNSDSPDVNTVITLCTTIDDCILPPQYRKEIWKMILVPWYVPDLSVSNPFDEKDENLLDNEKYGEFYTLLKEEVNKRCKEYGLENDNDIISKNIFKIIYTFCEHHPHINISLSLVDKVFPLILSGMSNDTAITCFHTLCSHKPPYISYTNYQPILRPHHLFRLLLTYHDAELSNFLTREYVYWFAPYKSNEQFHLPNEIQSPPLLPYNPSKSLKCGFIPTDLLISLFTCDYQLPLLHSNEIMTIWDDCIIHQDASWTIFLLLSIILDIKQRLLALKGPQLICDSIFSTIRQLKDKNYYNKISNKTEQLKRSTPVSVVKYINQILEDINIVDDGRRELVEDVKDIWKERLTLFYSNFSPSRINSVEALLNKYKGKEHLLELQIQERYGISNVLSQKTDYSKIDLGFCDLQSTLCLPISAKDIIIPLIKGKTDNKYILIDCRASNEIKNGNIGGSLQVNADYLDDYDDLYKTTIDSIKGRSHLVIMSTGINDDDDEINRLNPLLHKFLLENVNFVSVMRGGYMECHNIIMETEPGFLIDHNEKNCLICKLNKEKNLKESNPALYYAKLAKVKGSDYAKNAFKKLKEKAKEYEEKSREEKAEKMKQKELLSSTAQENSATSRQTPPPPQPSSSIKEMEEKNKSTKQSLKEKLGMKWKMHKMNIGSSINSSGSGNNSSSKSRHRCKTLAIEEEINNRQIKEAEKEAEKLTTSLTSATGEGENESDDKKSESKRRFSFAHFKIGKKDKNTELLPSSSSNTTNDKTPRTSTTISDVVEESEGGGGGGGGGDDDDDKISTVSDRSGKETKEKIMKNLKEWGKKQMNKNKPQEYDITMSPLEALDKLTLHDTFHFNYFSLYCEIFKCEKKEKKLGIKINTINYLALYKNKLFILKAFKNEIGKAEVEDVTNVENVSKMTVKKSDSYIATFEIDRLNSKGEKEIRRYQFSIDQRNAFIQSLKRKINRSS